jgi:hypothetical protein
VLSTYFAIGLVIFTLAVVLLTASQTLFARRGSQSNSVMLSKHRRLDYVARNVTAIVVLAIVVMGTAFTGDLGRLPLSFTLPPSAMSGLRMVYNALYVVLLIGLGVQLLIQVLGQRKRRPPDNREQRWRDA